MTQKSKLLISDFKNDKDHSNWHVADDGVMGGLSQGSMTWTNLITQVNQSNVLPY